MHWVNGFKVSGQNVSTHLVRHKVPAAEHGVGLVHIEGVELIYILVPIRFDGTFVTVVDGIAGEATLAQLALAAESAGLTVRHLPDELAVCVAEHFSRVVDRFDVYRCVGFSDSRSTHILSHNPPTMNEPRHLLCRFSSIPKTYRREDDANVLCRFAE